MAVALLAAVGGCSREQFRQRADNDVEGIISQKNIFPEWKVENWHVYPDSRARFADPSCPDYPAYPPDDYAAWLTSPNPQHPGRGGAGRYEGDGYLQMLRSWDAQNRAEEAAAEARDPTPEVTGGISGTDPGDPTLGGSAVAGATGTYLQGFALRDRPLKIRVDQAMEIAVLNAREFQDRREDLYLAALPVTLERYSFAAQAFASEQVIRESLGRQTPGGPAERWRINTEPGISKDFATGATLLVRLANQVVIEEANGEPAVITRAREYIAAHKTEPLALATVAKAAGASLFHFCKLFHKSTGLNFTEYVARARLEDARNGLRNPNRRISEVAYDVGFQSLTQFNRTFKRILGESPSEYREKLTPS